MWFSFNNYSEDKKKFTILIEYNEREKILIPKLTLTNIFLSPQLSQYNSLSCSHKLCFISHTQGEKPNIPLVFISFERSSSQMIIVFFGHHSFPYSNIISLAP